MFKRIFLFVLVNILVLVTISITLNVLGVRPYLSHYGIDYQALLAFCAVCGFSGAFISLALSRWMAKTMLGVRVIDPNRAGSSSERGLLQTVYRLAQRKGLKTMPEVGIYESPEVNAFATGPSRNRALVAVSSGLLQSMDSEALEGVLGHELSHVANGDMVTMTLLQGVINTFVMFFARIAAWAIGQALAGNDERRERAPNYFVQYILIFVFEVLFSLLGAVVVAFFSRWREFRADRGGAEVAGKEKMIHALESLKQTLANVDDSRPALSAFKINSGRRVLALLASHPDLDTRIARLRTIPSRGTTRAAYMPA